MFMVDVECVENLASGGDPVFLWGAHLDMPANGICMEATAVQIAGWALGRDSRAVNVELWTGSRLLARTPIGIERPDVAAVFSQARTSATSGFQTTLDVSGKEPRLTLEAWVVLASGQRLPFARVHLRRRWLPARGPGAGLVSIIIPCYNQAHFLPDAIESALAQTHHPVEVVVVDDGSPDNTAAIAASYPAVVLARQANQGLAAARNAGARASRGEYLVFLDADDRLLPEAVATNLAVLQAHPHAALALGRCRYVAADGNPITEQQAFDMSDPYAALLENCFIGMPGVVLYRRHAFRIAGQFDTAYGASADHKLYLRITRAYPIAFHNNLIGDYRKHGASMTQQPAYNLVDRMRMLRAERPYTRRNKLYRKAYREGVRLATEIYGRPLTIAVARHYQAGQWRQGLAGLRTLISYCPRELVTLMKLARTPERP